MMAIVSDGVASRTFIPYLHLYLSVYEWMMMIVDMYIADSTIDDSVCGQLTHDV